MKKWITWDTARNMFVAWLACLLFLNVMHMLSPDDPWADMLYRPVFLIVMPLLAACVPLLAAGPERAAIDDAEDEDDENFSRGNKPTTTDTLRRVAMVWLASLLIFASPHSEYYAALWDPIVHRAAFLIFAPLLLACIPALVPIPVRPRRAVPHTNPPLSRSIIGRGIVSCVVLALLAIGALLLINDTSLGQGHGSPLWVNLCFSIALLAALWRGCYFVKLLRASK